MLQKSLNKIVEDIYSSAMNRENWTKTLITLAEFLDYKGLAIAPLDKKEKNLRFSSSIDKKSAQ
ncbi:hypothetical protein HLH33_04955 [Gluconacetobacter diazotrophicus]|uniref:Uncharacterized protein n=1 Tax=Gluconacetobacter diazotrophicus TaxID=33996 RepID=A0A7W4FDH2_GLUDI|nr:hypothetical protein [Gluconacetobacter diazotrophicus]MBB2155662.1 hypothetical protein [Gluconacetobacter diazotrophicus]